MGTFASGMTASLPIRNVAGYARLSRDDRIEGESDSIIGQKKLIASWAEREGARIVRQYCDDGYSGTTFDRPGFKRMIGDAERGMFDTIVVKDLSRFGRSYLDCGSWIERELPKMGVRLYSISDGFDSMRAWDYDTALLLPIKNLMNEMYVASTSEKVRTALESKWERGEFVANFAPYGYMRDPNDQHRLVIDGEAAETVRRVFELRCRGESASGIARMLNEEGIACPAEHKRKEGSRYRTGFGQGSPSRWHAKTVTRILHNEVYTGTLVQGKTRRPNWRLHEGLPVPTDLQHKTCGAHEAIVDAETFNRANNSNGGVLTL